MKPHTKVKFEAVDCDKVGENIKGDDLRACRCCLSTKRKLYDLHGYALVEDFGAVTGIQVSPTDGFPQHICAMCGTWLKKSAAFQSMCRNTQTLLQEIRAHNPVITTQLLNITDTTCLELPFSTTNPLIIEYIPEPDCENVSAEVRTLRKRKCKEKHLNDTLKDVIKKEKIYIESNSADDNNDLDNNIDDFDNNYTSVDYLDSDFVANEKLEKNIKVEDNVDDKEAYSQSNTKKKKKLETNITQKVKKKTSKSKKIKDESTDVSNINLEDTEADIAVQKKKRMYNRKSEEEFEGFAKMHNVEVIFLTREQQMAELQARKESKDYVSARFQCEECYKSFMKESAYTKHMVWHDPSSGSHMCDICKIRFPVRHKLLKHLRRHRMHFICKLCNTISKDSTMAKLHFKWHEGFKYECQHCGRNFNKPSSYMNHVREMHAALTCDTCGLHVQGTRGLAAHRRLHAGIFKCNSCESQFHTEEALSRHLENITDHGCDPSVRPCPQCGASFLTAESLLEHMSLAHNDKIFRCEKCNTTYSSDRQLGVHWSRAHKGQRAPSDGAFICELCAKSFANETTLRYHQRVHTGEKPYPCTFCPKRFRMKINLQIHLNTHTGARPYKCPLCPETFKSYSQKHKHRLLVHTKERRHKCHMCEKTYVVSFDLKMHIRTAHMKIPRPPRNRRRNQSVMALNDA